MKGESLMKKRTLAVGVCAGLMMASFLTIMPGKTEAAAFESPIMNGDFENGKLIGWTVAGDRVVDVATKAGDVQGTGAMHYWSDKEFHFTVSQKITDVPDGLYSLSVMTQGGGGEKMVTLFADVDGQRKTVEIKNTGWNKWQPWIIDQVAVKGGTMTIGVEVNANAGNWGSIDNFVLTPVK